MKYNELNKKSVKELEEQSKELRKEMFQLKLKAKTAQLDDKSKVRAIRRDIARVETKITELNENG